MPQITSRTIERQHSSTTCPDCSGDVVQSDREHYCLLAGRSIEAGAAAAIFIVGRMNDCPRQAEPIVESARCSVDDLWKITGVLK